MTQQTPTSTSRIPGIYNYCNRWCERCRFTARCAVFASTRRMEAGLSGCDPDEPEEPPLTPQEAEERAAFLQELEDAGAFEPPTEADLQEELRRHEAIRRQVDGDPLMHLADAHATAVEVLAGELGPASALPAEQADAVEVLLFHRYLMRPKLGRALHGRFDDIVDAVDQQSDASGSAKVVLLGLDDVMRALLVIAGGRPAMDEIREAIELTIRLRGDVEARFPRARRFVRPGFDTEPC
jgi:hypothetical protein